jgi:hypothetical protein
MNDDEAIRAVALDYIEGWFDGTRVAWSEPCIRSW